ncbi:MAG: hypothetical protein ACI8P3_001390 [Saprospiraceae bacterium]|jgi:hypothetical protein
MIAITYESRVVLHFKKNAIIVMIQTRITALKFSSLNPNIEAKRIV